jgi:putative flippase GtrA
MLKFFVVNTIGFFLNATIVVMIVAHFVLPHGIFGSFPALEMLLWNILVGDKHGFPKLLINGAQLAATSLVMFWNYFANKIWTFKH